MKLNHNGKVFIMVIQDELEGIEKINYIFSEIQKIPEIKEFIKHNKKSLFNRGLIENKCYEIQFTAYNTQIYLSTDFIVG